MGGRPNLLVVEDGYLELARARPVLDRLNELSDLYIARNFDQGIRAFMEIKPHYVLADYDLEGIRGIFFGSDRTGLMLASVIRSIEEKPSEIYINSIRINLGMAPQETISWNNAVEISLIDGFFRKWNIDGLIAKLEMPMYIPEINSHSDIIYH